MAPSGSDAILFDVHNDGNFFFLPLRLPECEQKNDSDLFAMYDYAEMYRILNMYMAHVPQNLLYFYYQNLCLDGSGDEVTSRRRFHEIRKKDAGNMTIVTDAPKGRKKLTIVDIRDKCMRDSAEVERPAQENQNPTFMDETSRDSGSEHVFNNNVYSGSDSESDYSNKAVDYLLEGADEDDNEFYLILAGERFVDVEQLKECTTYYALANGFSLWFYRSLKDKLIAKCGLIPEK
nr:potassium channel, voltage-dependent, EAG/ELK/ERG, ankyrin repeat-containing domain protein [Tanacetum cinerariifolium]